MDCGVCVGKGRFNGRVHDSEENYVMGSQAMTVRSKDTLSVSLGFHEKHGTPHLLGGAFRVLSVCYNAMRHS